jgi:hypothetical protein
MKEEAVFIILMHLADGSRSPAHMDGHKAWIRQGFADGVLYYVGGRRGGGGNAMIASGITHDDLLDRVGKNPFVINGVVTSEVIELDTTLSDPRLGFMVEFQGDRLGYQAQAPDAPTDVVEGP